MTKKQKTLIERIFENNGDLLKGVKTDIAVSKFQRYAESHYGQLADQQVDNITAQADLLKEIKKWKAEDYVKLIDLEMKFNELQEKKDAVEKNYKRYFGQNIPKQYTISIEDILEAVK